MTKKFLKAVKAEIVALRENATKSERNKLVIKYFDPGSKSRCIYGLMTGHCFSDRATELILKCAKYMVEDLGYGKLTKTKRQFRDYDWCSYQTTLKYTALESFIFQFAATKEVNKNILFYIKGRTNKLPEILENV